MCLANIEATISPSLADALPSADRLCNLGDRLTDPGERAVCYTAAAALRRVAGLVSKTDWSPISTAPADKDLLVIFPVISDRPVAARFDSVIQRWHCER